MCIRDRYPLLIRKYCIIKKGKSRTGHWADSIHVFLSSVTRETLTYDIMHNLPSSCHPVNLCLIFMYTRDVKLSFPNNNIEKLTFKIFTLYVTVLTGFQENDPNKLTQLVCKTQVKWSFVLLPGAHCYTKKDSPGCFGNSLSFHAHICTYNFYCKSYNQV